MDTYLPYVSQQNAVSEQATELIKAQVEQKKTGERCGELEREMILRIEELAKVEKTIAKVAAQDFAKDIKDVQRLVRTLS